MLLAGTLRPSARCRAAQNLLTAQIARGTVPRPADSFPRQHGAQIAHPTGVFPPQNELNIHGAPGTTRVFT